MDYEQLFHHIIEKVRKTFFTNNQRVPCDFSSDLFLMYKIYYICLHICKIILASMSTSNYFIQSLVYFYVRSLKIFWYFKNQFIITLFTLFFSHFFRIREQSAL